MIFIAKLLFLNKSSGIRNRILTVALLCAVFALLSNPPRASEKPVPLNVVVHETTEPIHIATDGIGLENSLRPPAAHPDLPDLSQWQHIKRTSSPKQLAGMPGSLTTDHFSGDNVYLARELWRSADKNIVAVRQKFLNKSKQDIYLNYLYPIYCKGPRGFCLENNGDASRLRILIQQRLKNGRPQVIQPSGDQAYEIDQFCVFRDGGRPENPLLLIGFLSQTGHCARIKSIFKNGNNKTQFDLLVAESEMDSILVPPGGERFSQWVYLTAGYDANAMIARFADCVGEYHGVKHPPADAPSVFCTWYFHGYHYNEEFFHNDLKALQNKHLPFDVFLIDECWSLNQWGDFEAIATWPGGMKDAADRIRALGYIPGIWSCPYLVDFKSKLAQDHPEWLLKNRDGERITFYMNRTDHWVLDLTFPGVCDFLEETYRKLAGDWGYAYFKFDFMRAVFLEKGQRFFDPTATRLEAYRRGLEAIRRGVGPDAYISVCGGHYGGSLGIANSQRSGSDVVSLWREKEIPKFRQNILRTWMSRLWHVDPDAMMVRKRSERFHGESELSLGLLTDDEANTIALNQYVGGGLISCSEYLPELSDDRRALYRHVIPSINSVSVPLDPFNPVCPTKLLTVVTPVCENLPSWVTVAVINWSDEPESEYIDLNENICHHLSENYLLVFEFFSQKILGIFQEGERIDPGVIAPHNGKLLRISPWNGRNPVLAGTDLHFSGGGVEIAKWQQEGHQIKGRIRTPWQYRVKITAAFPDKDIKSYSMRSAVVRPGQNLFWIEIP